MSIPNVQVWRNSLASLGFLALTGCFSPDASIPRGEAAHALMPAPRPDDPPVLYRIGASDTLSIRVFQEPELSFEEISVDAGGGINYPLIGAMQAAGKTPFELSKEIERGLGSRFIRSPQVVVGMVKSSAQRVVVEGNVVEPGVYDITGRSTLLESLARAKGPTRVAMTDQILVFREIAGQRVGARFDLRQIREGRAPDPEILRGDVIVVGFSAVKGAYRDFISAAPLFNVFTQF